MLTNRQETPEGQSGTQQQLRLVVDEDPPLTDRASLDRWLDRRMHTIYVGMKDERGRVPSEGISDIRRNRRTPWRTTSKRIYEAMEAGVPYESVEEIPILLQQYAHAARIICAREKGRPYLRAASLLLVALLGGFSACTDTTAPVTAARAITIPKASDTGAWVPRGPAPKATNLPSVRA
jgi:hypothetical protein